MELNDTYSWQNFKEGDKEALANLFTKYYPDLITYGVKIIADKEIVQDCIQELFIEIFKQKNPPTIISIKAYLLKALKYKLIKLVEKNKRTTSFNAISEATNFEISIETVIINKQIDKDTALKIIAILEQLPKKQREIIYLKFYANLSYQEICEVMNIKYQVARNQVSQAIKFIKSQYNSRGIFFWF